MYIYFYLEAYYIKKYDLLKRLNDFQPEAHLHGQTWSAQHLDIILRYIEECGKVSRSDVQKHLELNTSAAIRLMKKLKDGGLVTAIGKGKNVKYTIAG